MVLAQEHRAGKVLVETLLGAARRPRLNRVGSDYLVITRPTRTMNIPAKRIPVIGTNIAGSQAAA